MMGIRRRKSTVLLLTVVGLTLIYIYFVLDPAFSAAATSSSYAGRDKDASFRPGQDEAAAKSQSALNHDALRFIERAETAREKQHREHEGGKEMAEDDEIQRQKRVQAKLDEGAEDRQLDEGAEDRQLDEGAEDRQLDDEDERDEDERRQSEEGDETEREKGGEGEYTGEEGKGKGTGEESGQNQEGQAGVKGQGANGRPSVERMEQRESREDADQSRHVTRLIVLAYMRTGSSMTGRFIRFSPDIFYVYEPLHTLERYYVTGGHPDSPYRNKTLNEWFKASDMAAGNTSALLSCDIAHVYSGILLDPFTSIGDANNHAFHRCFSSVVSVPDVASRARLWGQCETNMTQTCRKAYKVTAVKTIRLTMARALEIMRDDPKIKILHLTRDPRGILLSRSNIGYANFDQLKDEASLLCKKIQEDLDQVLNPIASDAVEVLQLKSRYWLVRYEDIAREPLDFAQQLYQFMGIGLTEQILQSVKKMMESAKHRKDCPTCPPTKLNSTEVSQAWRQKLTLGQVEDIASGCAGVMASLGYRVKFDDEAGLRDPLVPAVGPLALNLD